MDSEFDLFAMDSSIPTSPIQLTDDGTADPCDNGPYNLFKDDYLEDLILREPQLMNQYAEDLKSFNMKKCCKEVLTEDYIQRFQYLWTDGSAYHVRKMRIKKLLRDKITHAYAQWTQTYFSSASITSGQNTVQMQIKLILDMGTQSEEI